MSNPEQEKYLQLEAIKEKVNHIKDRFGKPVDESIKEAVVFLNALGVQLNGSCEGHFQSEGQGPQGEKIVKTLGPSLDIFPEKSILTDANYLDPVIIEEYSQMSRANAEKAKKLLAEFYHDDQPGTDEKSLLVFQLGGIYGNGTIKGADEDNLSEKDPVAQKKYIEGTQREMARFTEFLKKKYFGK